MAKYMVRNSKVFKINILNFYRNVFAKNGKEKFSRNDSSYFKQLEKYQR